MMKVATWNINGFGARQEFLLRWLADRKPDVVGLQELKLTDDAFPHKPFNDLGYQVITHGQKAWNGVAVLSRFPMEIRQIGLAGQDDFGSRFIDVSIGDRFNFATVYCPNGKSLDHADFERKLQWFDSLQNYWAAADSTSAILCGDFNIAPSALDGWKGSGADGDIFHTPQERLRFQSLLDQGLTDLFRHKYPSEQAFSWWDYRGGSFHRGHGLRIDLILATSNIVAQLVEVGTDREFRKKLDGMTASDHAPVIAELE
tara:strand:+ start:272 stop:1045 length:774 start_codon:yes stop_codon:yes gene_type:complete